MHQAHTFETPGCLQQFPRVALTKHANWTTENNRNSLSYISGDQKSEIKVFSGLVSSEAAGENPLLPLPASGDSCQPWASGSVTPSSAPPPGFLHCVSRGLLMRTPGIGFRNCPHSVWFQRTLTNSARSYLLIENVTIPWHSPQRIQFSAQHWHTKKQEACKRMQRRGYF